MTSSLRKQIAALALPAIVVNITTPLLSISDVAIAGHLGDTRCIAAIAAGSTAFNLLYWLLGFLRMGTSGLTAQAHGATDSTECRLIALRALTIALVAGLLFSLFNGPLCRLSMLLLDIQGHTASLASDYFMICIWGAPAVLGTFALTGWFVGMQNTRVPMYVSIIIDIFNIALSALLALYFRMGVTGIAIGTLAAQWLGFALLLLRWWTTLRRLSLPKLATRPLLDNIGRLLRVNADIFLRTLCLVSVTLWFTRTGAAQGAEMLAVNALLMQMFTLFSYFTDGLAFAAEAICGKYSGENNHPMLSLSVRTFLRIGLYGALLFSAVYLLLGSDFLALLTDDAATASLAATYSLWAVFIPIAGFLGFIWDGICIGLTNTRAMLATMLSATAIFFITYSLAFPSLQNHGLWLAFILYLLCRGITLTIIHRRLLR